MSVHGFPSCATPHSQRATGSFPAAQQSRAKVRVVRHYTASDEFIAPSTECYAIVQGGGAGGGSTNDSGQGASGGSAGETATGLLRLTPGARYTITVGAGGAAASSGGASSIVGEGVHLRAAGGNPGVSSGAVPSSAGSTNTSTILETQRLAGAVGGAGGLGTAGSAGATSEGVPGGSGGAFSAQGGGGGGGASPFGVGGAGGAGNANGIAAPVPNTGAGGGGAGGTSGALVGGSGSAGFVRVIYDE